MIHFLLMLIFVAIWKNAHTNVDCINLLLYNMSIPQKYAKSNNNFMNGGKA